MPYKDRNARNASQQAWRHRTGRQQPKRKPDPQAALIRKQERMHAAYLVGKRLIADAKNVPCADCGQRFPVCCMDFDHRDGKTKSFCVSKYWKNDPARLLAEMAKCDVVCSNCHRIRTHERGRYRVNSTKPLNQLAFF